MSEPRAGTCGRCGARIWLVKFGRIEDSYRWVTDRAKSSTAACQRDDRHPRRVHAPGR